MKKTAISFEQCCKAIFGIVLGFIISYLLYLSIFMTAYIHDVEDTYYVYDSVNINIYALLLVIGLFVFILCKNISLSDKFIKIYCLCINVIFVLFVLGTQFISNDDQGTVLSVAASFVHGNFSAWEFGGYAFRLAHQNGIILIYSLLSFILGDSNEVAFQLLNVLFIALTHMFIYKIFKKFINDNNICNIILFFVYSFIPYWFFTAFVYGTVIGMMFMMGGIYFSLCFLENYKIKNMIISALMIAIACTCKSNFYISLIGLMIVLFINIFRKKMLFMKLTHIVIILVFCVLSSYLVDGVISYKTGHEVNEGSPYTVYVAMGLKEGWKAPGWNNSFNDRAYFRVNFDTELAKAYGTLEIRKEINNFVNNKEYAKEFFAKKVASMWANPTFECFEQFRGRQAQTGVNRLIRSLITTGSRLNKLFVEIFDIFMSVIYLGVFIYCILRLMKADIKELVLLICFVGYFIFQLFWEGRCYYTLVAFVMLIPYAVLGYVSIANKLNEMFANISIHDMNATRNIIKERISTINLLKFVCIAAFVIITIMGYNKISYKYIPNEKDYYLKYIERVKYDRKIANLECYIIPELYKEKSLDITKNNMGISLLLSDKSNSSSQRFIFADKLYRYGENYYYITNCANDNVVYLRDEADMLNGTVYLQEYSRERKSLCQVDIVEESDGVLKVFIRNMYGLALEYSENGNVIWGKPTKNDNQIWNIIIA